MSPTSHRALPAPGAIRALNRLAVTAGQAVRARAHAAALVPSVARRPSRHLGRLCLGDRGRACRFRSRPTRRVFTALGVPLDMTGDPTPPGAAAPGRGQDLVHSAMGELEAPAAPARSGSRLPSTSPTSTTSSLAVRTWSRGTRQPSALLHIENRTQFPNVQEALGGFGSKRAYLGGVLAARLWARQPRVGDRDARDRRALVERGSAS